MNWSIRFNTVFSGLILLAMCPIRVYAYSGTPESEIWSFLTLLFSVPATLLFLFLYLASKFRWLAWALGICALTSVIAFLIFHADRSLTTVVILFIVIVTAVILNWRRNQKEQEEWQRMVEDEFRKQRENDQIG